MPRDQIPYVILGSNLDQNIRFYTGYDEHFLFNKVVTFLYVLNVGESAITGIEEYLAAAGGRRLSERYLESIRAEIFFTALHQCETFFALLIAPFRSLAHWLYLTTYETREIKHAVDLIVAGKIGELTDGKLTTMQDFIKVAVYSEFGPTDLQAAGMWDENIDNAAWLVERIGQFFFKYDRAYNSYKHGLRVMTGPHQLSIGLQNPSGTTGPMRVIQASEDAVRYLQKEPVREVDGEREIPISEVTKAFNPFEASFYLAKMNQMLETIKATRLAFFKDGGEVPPDGERINMFLALDRDEVRQLEKIDEWKESPARADQARAYSRYVAQMQAQAAQPTDNTSEEQENDEQR
jgi:hypothetical protein